MESSTTIVAITTICYLVGTAAKATEKVKDKYIPVICGVTGAVLGIAGMYLMTEYPATDLINAAALGITSGMAATGLNQIKKQIGKES